MSRLRAVARRVLGPPRGGPGTDPVRQLAIQLFGRNRKMAAIERLDHRTAQKIAAFRGRRQAAAPVTDAEAKVMHSNPYFGIVPCRVADIDFVMFHANDDIVARHMLWCGPDSYEPDIVPVWVDWCRAGGQILDVGGYSGLMSILAALANPQADVHLFEPIESVWERANVNVKINSLARVVRLHNLALSDTGGSAEMHLYRDPTFLGTGSSITPKGKKATVVTKTVRTARLDDLLPDAAPTAVKIDVEGHEHRTLVGMEATLARARPKIVIEIWNRNLDTVEGFFRNLGYSLDRVVQDERPVSNYFATP